MAENYLTVAALRSTTEADLIRGKLEAAGIPSVLVEPEAPAAGAPASRVQVQVSQPDFERAMQLLFPIPKINPSARPAQPGWKCPQCGQQVMGSFPRCWSCGTPREGPAGGAALPPLGPPGGELPLPPAPTLSPSAAPSAPMPPISVMPPMPAAPLAGMPPRLETPPRITMPSETAAPASTAVPTMTIPPLAGGASAPADSPAAAPNPAANGASPLKGLSLPVRRLTRTAEEDGFQIVVPPWNPATAKGGKGTGTANKRGPTDADDRAARRAWWTAVFGIVCPPLLIYSIGVVLILGLSNRPLSRRGDRFFYGALALNALIIAAFFALRGMQQ